MSKLQVKIDGEIWEKGKLFVCPDQTEELEVELGDIENTVVAKSIMEIQRKESGNAENQG